MTLLFQLHLSHIINLHLRFLILKYMVSFFSKPKHKIIIKKIQKKIKIAEWRESPP